MTFHAPSTSTAKACFMKPPSLTMSQKEETKTFEEMEIDDAEEKMDDEEDYDDEDDEEEEDNYDDYTQDEWFDGFLDDNKPVPEDELTEEIMHLLKIGMISANRQQVVSDVLSRLNDQSFLAFLPKLIVRYVLECPPSNLEMVRRYECVAAVLKAWNGSGPVILDAINDVLKQDEPLNHIPSRNLHNFIRCLLEEDVFKKEDLLLFKTRETSLIDAYVDRLYKLVYNYHKTDAPVNKTTKPTSSWLS